MHFSTEGRTAMPTSTALKVAPTENGCIIRIEGRGTMKESPAASGLANRTLAGDASAVVVIDLLAPTLATAPNTAALLSRPAAAYKVSFLGSISFLLSG